MAEGEVEPGGGVGERAGQPARGQRQAAGRIAAGPRRVGGQRHREEVGAGGRQRVGAALAELPLDQVGGQAGVSD
ncbi:hypothetical protein, partial [Azospirillum brasilense]|uniref:hypothetical protein n=1 Tax=Azospirillum brasilense TaxID=192 RepID=UPI001B3B4CF7